MKTIQWLYQLNCKNTINFQHKSSSHIQHHMYKPIAETRTRISRYSGYLDLIFKFRIIFIYSI